MLSDVHFKHSYSSGLDEPKEFFTEALIESTTFDLGLGFFSSSGIRSLASGFALFIANGGRMRVVINHILSKEDKDAIENGQKHLVDEFECTDGLKWGESPLTVEVDESLLSTNAIAEENYNEREKLFQNRDPRLRETVTHSGYATFPDEGFEENGRIKMTDQQQTGFGMMKLLQPTTEMPSYSTISDADVIILRYAEVLLMIAEAENEANGPTQKVYDAVNAVRARSEMPPLPEGLTQDEMRERIRHENRVEFAFEGQRYFQLKRWKLMEELVNGAVDPALPVYIKVFKPAFYYWPIPQSEIDKAGGILEQDPNYA